MATYFQRSMKNHDTNMILTDILMHFASHVGCRQSVEGKIETNMKQQFNFREFFSDGTAICKSKFHNMIIIFNVGKTIIMIMKLNHDNNDPLCMASFLLSVAYHVPDRQREGTRISGQTSTNQCVSSTILISEYQDISECQDFSECPNIGISENIRIS